MSLQVWLPLTKDLRQQGLSNIDIEAVTNTVFDNNGKIGKCLSGGKIKIPANQVTSIFNNTSMSIAFWYNNNTSESTGNHAICGFSGNSEGDTDSVRIWDFFNYSIPTQFHWSMGTLGGGSLANVFPANTWVHVTVTWQAPTLKIYIDGELRYTGSGSSNYTFDKSYYISFGHTPQKLNDFRIYDHCLSQMEVKELAKGLVLHYPLSNNSIQQLNNCYNYPTFNTSSASGGWQHWGQSGASGSYGQTTDSRYIYRKDQLYAHWFANAVGATGDYLLYQSPTFEGGKRSVQCICKEENGLSIEESIVRPVWNARSGGATIGKWTSITLLDNDFYYCKCENIQQSGSDDLVGFYIKPGYKVYFSEAYLEDNRDVSSDIFFPTNIIYDCSGFCNNGEIIDSLSVSSDTPKYSVSTHISATNQKIHISNFPTSGFGNSYSFAWWGKRDSNSPMFWGFSDGIRLNGMYAGTLWNTGDGSNNPIYKPNTTTTITAPSVNVWHHYVMTGDGTTCKLYIDGELYGQAKTYKAIGGTSIYINGWDSSTSYCSNNTDISDFRIYATALSAEDVLSLYNNSAYIDSSGNVYGAIIRET